MRITGGGLAAICCWQLSGRRAEWRRGERRGPERVVMLSPATRDLLGHAFPGVDLASGLHRIERRIVRWGGGTRVLPHDGLVIAESVLMERLEAAPAAEREPIGDWMLDTVPDPAGQIHFGDRPARAEETELAAGDDPGACVMTAEPDGWSFLLPTGVRSAWLLQAGEAVSDGFPAHARMSAGFGEGRTLRCGAAAAAFDPICGDGVGHAARMAILACAVLAQPDPPVDEYAYRIRLGVNRHLDLCRQFYALGGDSPWWRRQAEMAHPVECAPGPLRWVLDGFDLRRAA